MKYLDARKADGKEQKDSVVPENKMQRGSRLDQGGRGKQNPEDLVSSPRAALNSNVDKNVRRLAHDLGVDISTVKGTGANGEVTEKDVRLAKREQNQQGGQGQENK